MYVVDGNISNTKLLKDILPGEGSSDPQRLVDLNGTLFFRANDGIHGDELWSSQGTAATTQMVIDIYPGAVGSAVNNLTKVGNTLFFSATTLANGHELWKTEGTAVSTQLFQDLYVGAESSYPKSFHEVNGSLFFSAFLPSTGYENWIYNPAQPFPVELLEFSATPIDQQVNLSWTTLSEVNNDFFTIERSIDGQAFEQLELVQGIGNSDQVQQYQTVDYTPFQGTSYYRLKQTDINGAFTYTQIVEVNLEENGAFTFTLYPNPIQGNQLQFSPTGAKGNILKASIYDLQGRRLLHSSIDLTEHHGPIILHIGDQLSQGYYLLHLSDGLSRSVKRFQVVQ